MNVLLVDDDRDLVDLITYALVRRGHQVVAASDGAQALHRWQTEQPDLLLLDVVMPRTGGLEVCRQIRQSSPVPIIMISAYGDEDDLVRAYESGADDYIVKPFSMRQLLLRMDTVMRRVDGSQHGAGRVSGQRITIDDLVIEPGAFEVCKNGTPLILTRLEFRILYCLAHGAGTLVETQRLASTAWQSAGGGDATLLKTHVSHIRQKLAEAGGSPIQIRAVPRAGYILSAKPEPRAAPEGMAALVAGGG